MLHKLKNATGQACLYFDTNFKCPLSLIPKVIQPLYRSLSLWLKDRDGFSLERYNAKLLSMSRLPRRIVTKFQIMS